MQWLTESNIHYVLNFSQRAISGVIFLSLVFYFKQMLFSLLGKVFYFLQDTFHIERWSARHRASTLSNGNILTHF